MKLVSKTDCNGRVCGVLTARDGGQDMSDSIEEKEPGGHGSLDKHDHAGCDHCQDSNDVHRADAIQDNVARSGQRLGRESHLAASWCFRFDVLGCEDAGDLVEAVGLDWDVQQSTDVSLMHLEQCRMCHPLTFLSDRGARTCVLLSERCDYER
jgi:hypothetical protein